MPIMQNPTLKPWLAVTVFSAIALLTLLLRAPIAPELFPEIVFFAMLILNTFFSVQFYSKIQPENRSQMAIDGILLLTYIALALSLGRPVEFALAALCLFAVAPFKYVLMLGRIPYEHILRRKIKIDATGAALCTAFLGATLLDYGFFATWAFAIIFALANICLLIIRPMYRL